MIIWLRFSSFSPQHLDKQFTLQYTWRAIMRRVLSDLPTIGLTSSPIEKDFAINKTITPRLSKCREKLVRLNNLNNCISHYHYKISQFYRRKYSVDVWLAVHRWFIYRHLHRRIKSVDFPFIDDSPFRRYIGRKNKKTICWWFYRRNLRAKKKFPAWNILTDFIPSVISWFTDGYVPLVNLSVSVWNTDRIYSSVNSSVSVAVIVKCRRIQSVGKAVGECLKYRPNVSVCKCVGECYCQMPMDSFRW